MVAWGWIGNGAVMMGAAFIGTALAALLGEIDSARLPAELAPLRSLIDGLAIWRGTLLAGLFLLGFGVTFAAARLLAGRRWARAVLEWCSWLAAATTVLVALFLSGLWGELIVALDRLTEQERDTALVVGRAAILISAVVLTAPLVWMAGYLRLARVRDCLG